MDDRPGGPEEPRSPTAEDVERLVLALEAQGVRYAIIGGIAMQFLGLQRATADIDLLVDPSPQNVERIRLALSYLEDRAVLEVGPQDVAEYTVVRVADEIVIDLLGSACGVAFDDVVDQIVRGPAGSATASFLSPSALLRTKQTVRPKDAVDREFLERVMALGSRREA